MNEMSTQSARSIFSAITADLSKRDYGQILIWMAVGVGLPRWAGAMLAADGIQVMAGSTDVFVKFMYWLLVLLFGLSSFGMALLEVLAIGYVFDALRALKPKTTAGKINLRWWGSLLFGIILLIMMPIILGPHMLAQLHKQDIIQYLETDQNQIIWVVTVILAPTVIIGGVSFARDGMVGVTQSDAAKPPTKPAKAPINPVIPSDLGDSQSLLDPTPQDVQADDADIPPDGEQDPVDVRRLKKQARAKARREARKLASENATNFPQN